MKEGGGAPIDFVLSCSMAKMGGAVRSLVVHAYTLTYVMVVPPFLCISCICNDHTRVYTIFVRFPYVFNRIYGTWTSE